MGETLFKKMAEKYFKRAKLSRREQAELSVVLTRRRLEPTRGLRLPPRVPPTWGVGLLA